MQVTRPGGDAERSFTTVSRRAQIVEATIETIAELGYAQASFARIAERAGLSSTRLISYHFAGKQELIEQVAEVIVGDLGAFVGRRLSGESSAGGALRAYIEANIEYLAGHRTAMKALLGIFLNGALPVGRHGVPDPAAAISPIEQILRDGQRAGEFRSFDATVVAACIQRTIEGIPMLLESHPELDLTACTRELVTMFELCVWNDR